MHIDTPLGEDVLLLQALTGHDGISELFRYDLELFSEDDSITFADIVGKRVTITLVRSDGSEECLNGFVSRFAQRGKDRMVTCYQAEVVPWVWFLTRNANCRIFQKMKVPDIITKVFRDRGFQDFKESLQGTYEQRDYCVQYRETDFNFVSRLMEQYGIAYYFEHTNQSHTLVLADYPGAYKYCAQQTVACDLAGASVDHADMITGWQVEQELRTGKYTHTDYNFETPQTSLISTEPTIISVDGNSAYEIYDYPGEYPNKAEGGSLAKVRMQEEETTSTVVRGTSECRAFVSGFKFDLADHYRRDANAPYLLTQVQHVATEGDTYLSGGTEKGEHYSNHFTCIPAHVPYRPLRRTPRPFVQGPQTAVVVGKSGEEIWVDKYGRVKVQFFWDREGKKDENSSCWVRVSQAWAGKKWGAMWIPRIGQEVIVDFLEGDPDRPLITGRVYNADQMPPYDLPTHQTRSTFQSRSSKGGGTGNYNEIRFEDKKGSEQIFINAEKDMDQRVENDSREYIGANRYLIVGANQEENVKKEKHLHVEKDQFETIDASMSLEVGGDRMESIGGDESLNVSGQQSENVGGDKSLTVGGNSADTIGGELSLTVGGDQNTSVGGGLSLSVSGAYDETVGKKHAVQAGMEIHLKAGMKVIIEAGAQLSLLGPGGFIDIGPAGIAIQGTMVLINSGGAAGSGSGASPKSPKSPKKPKAPKKPKKPKTADDGSKGGAL